MKAKKTKRSPGRRPLPIETQNKIKKILKNGGTYREAALAVGTSATAIWRYNKKWGL